MKTLFSFKSLEKLKDKVFSLKSDFFKSESLNDLSPKDQLLSEIQRAKHVDKKKIEALKEMEKKKLYARAKAAAHTADFEENKILLSKNTSDFSAQDINEFKSFIRLEELNFLENSFNKNLKKRRFELAESMLPEIHLRSEAGDYDRHVLKLEECKNKKSTLGSLKSFLSSLYKKKPQEKQKDIHDQEPIPAMLDTQIIEKDALPQVMEKPVAEKPTIEKSNITEEKKSSVKEKIGDKLRHWKNVVHLMKKEHKGQKVDSVALTDDIAKRSEDTQTFEKPEMKSIPKEEKPELPQENASEFENIFGVSNQDEKDILDTLLKTEEEQSIEKEKVKERTTNFKDLEKEDSKSDFQLVDLDEDEAEVEYVNPFLPYIQLSLQSMIFSLCLLLFSFLFFFIQLDPENRILSILGQKNLYAQQEEKKSELDSLNKGIADAELSLKKLKEGSFNIHAKVGLDEVMLQKINWIEVREDLHQATLQAFPYNDVLKYIQYNTFTGEAARKNIKIAGTVIDPSGRVFLLLTKLVNSINLYPSFSGAEVSTFSKSENGDEEIGGYTSSFSLDLQYKVVEEEKEE